ncbi:glycoside hydrolase family 2 protein, partial [Micromonospora sp. BQ11]|uniref:glycoside hydrolase family 2 protein n=1 Tax=Micromonospora sp. BQ11 TaxID=3452212 RepID=UPI003F88841D
MSSSGRSRLPLDGRWRLRLLDVPGHAGRDEVEVDVPGSWTLQVPGCEQASGVVRYARPFAVPAAWPADGVLVLLFGAVNHAAEVSLNGTVVGRHEGGWTPFEVPLDRRLLTGGDEVVEVVVSYPPLLATDTGAAGLQETPHGKQTWYGSNAGIWQPVTLECRPPRHVARARVRADAVTGRVAARVTLAGPPATGTRVDLVVRQHGSGTVVARSTSREPDADDADDDAVALDAVVAGPRLWSPEHPHLYDVVVELYANGDLLDATTVTTGFRTIATKNGSVLLNGEPIEIRGVLDQDYHPGSELRPRAREELEQLFGEAKRLGFNLLRCHIKRPDPAYFEVADRLGLLVWAELPSWQRFTPRSTAAAESLLTEMIDTDGHHPSIAVWTVVNESWGVDLRDAEQRAWLRRTWRHAVDLAPGTLVVDNSPCEPNFHVRTDLDDYHVYRGIPERRASWDAWVDAFVQRPAWTFSPYGDARRTGEEPLVVSEFGNWGLPDVTETTAHDGAEPWWAEAGQDWAFGAAHASGLVSRFERLGLGEVFGSWRAFVEAVQRQQLLGIRYQIGSLRRRPEIAGYVLTQLSDVQWEANGLFDMDRRPRLFTGELALMNGPCAVVLRPIAHACLSDAELEVTVDVVPPPGGMPDTAWTVLLSVDGAAARQLSVPADRRSSVTARLRMPAGPALASVRAELHTGTALLARDAADVAVLAPPPERQRPVRVDDDVLAGWLPQLGVPTLRESGDDVLLVTRHFGSDAQALARRGGRVLVVAEDREALGDAFAAPLLARLSPRAGDGDWVPCFDWLRRHGPFAALPGGPLLDLAFEHVIGDLVIDFLPAPLRPAYLHSATFAGWLRHRASTSLTVPWSAGAVTITTFRLRTAG